MYFLIAMLFSSWLVSLFGGGEEGHEVGSNAVKEACTPFITYSMQAKLMKQFP